MCRLFLIAIGLLVSAGSFAQPTDPDLYAEASFNARDGRVQQAFLDSINQGLSIKVNGEDMNTVQLKQRRSRNLTESEFSTIEKWRHLCSETEGVEKWAASQCMAFAHTSLNSEECGREEWCFKFQIASFVKNDPALLGIVRTTISSPCSHAQSKQPGGARKNSGRGILPPGEAKRWLLCDSKTPVSGVKKIETTDGVFVISILRKK